LWDNDGDQVLAYQRGEFVFVFNFNGEKSYTDYGILADKGVYQTILNSDNPKFGGFGIVDESIEHFSLKNPVHESGREWLKLYIPARSGMVLKKVR
jgi:1,4-alpha-glucan branching enzyme